MKRRNVIITTIVAGALATVTAVGAANAFSDGGCGFGHGGMHGARFGGDFRGGPGGAMGMASNLNLTKDQWDKIGKIMDAERSKVRDKMYSMMESRKALRTAAQATTYDAKKVRELADTQAKIMAELIVLKTETQHKIRAVLTPEQRTQLDTMRQGRFNRRGPWNSK